MKNYYDQVNEREIAKARLKTLEEKKKMYFEMISPKSGAVRGIGSIVGCGQRSDAFGDYVIKIEPIDAEIGRIKEEIRLLDQEISTMEKCLRSMTGTLEKVFVLRYIDGLSVNQICRKLHYSRAQVYRQLSAIKDILKFEKKMRRNEKNIVV